MSRSAAVCLVLIVLCRAGTAVAAPKTGEAKAAFDRGIAAYQKQNYAAAADALARSYGLEPDPETLFAWAQTERQLEHCDKASDLYRKLLQLDLPSANADVIRTKLDECKAILAARPLEKPEPRQPPRPKPEPPPPAVSRPLPEEPTRPPEGRAWWKNPVGGALVGAGAVGLGLGTYFLVSANSANNAAKATTNYDDFRRLDDRATSRGKLAVITGAAGSALVIAGIVWYATHRSSERTLTAWILPADDGNGVAGGGLVALGRF